MVQVLASMGDGAVREGGEVPYGLLSGVQSQGLSESGRLGPETQLQPIYGHGGPVWCLPGGTLAQPQAQDAYPAPTSQTSDKDAGGQYLHRVAAYRSKSGQTGGAPQLMDIG